MHFLTRAKKRVISAICACALAFTATTAYTGGVGGTRPITVAAADGESTATTYDFRDGSIVPADTSYNGSSNLTSGNLTIKPGSKNGFGYNGNQHGAIFKDGNSIEIKVEGPTKVTVGDCASSNATELTVKSADNSYTETKNTKTGCYHNDGSAMVFKYTGNAATTLIIEFTNTTYVPIIITEPITAPTAHTYDFRDGSIVPADTSYNGGSTLISGDLTIKPGSKNGFGYNGNQHGAIFKDGNSIEIKVEGPTKVTVGDCASSNATELTVKSADNSYTETKNTKTGCYHNDGSAMVFKYTGNAATTLIIEFTNTTYVPIIITEPITAPTAHTYDFRDGSIVPADTSYNGGSTLISGDLTIKPGSKNGFGYNGNQHGAIFKDGNSIEIKVEGPTKVTVGDCASSNATELTIKSADNSYTETKNTKTGCYHNDGSALVFNYTGKDETTLIIEFTNTTYVPIIITEPIEVTEEPDPTVKPDPIGNGKADVWDFGAEQLDTTLYNNMLTVDIINALYPEGTAVGANTANLLQSLTLPGDLSLTAAKKNIRIMSTNAQLIRHSEKVLSEGTGYLYCDSAAKPENFFSIKLNANDILSVYAGGNNGDSTMVCEAPSGDKQSAVAAKSGQWLTFYAGETGTYKIYSENEKLSVGRIIREHPNPVEVSGSVDTTAATGIGAYKLCFTNTSTGKATEVTPTNDAYTVYLYDSYTYEMSLVDANGYIIKDNAPLAIAKGSGDMTKDIAIESVSLVTVTGKITGLSADALKALKLSFVNKDYPYVPEVTITGNDITVQLETGVTYDIVAEGINDYELSGIKTISETGGTTQNIAFALKPTYAITVTLTDLPESAKSSAVLTFTNINEEGYTYTFEAGETPELRDGSYTVKVTGIGSVPYVQKLTSNVNVNGAAVSKTIGFEPIEAWDFSQYNGKSNLETIGGNKYYLGLALTGNVQENKTYLLAKTGDTIEIPVKKGQIVTLNYCYQAAFEVEGKQAFSASDSESKIETIQVTASDDGFITVKGITGTTEDGKSASQTFFTKITVATAVELKSKLTVGADKEYQTINEALAAAAKMDRPNNERVEIVIDPGNYEEMLVVNIPNVTLKNAADENASLAITNNGVDIGANVVRITSYYGHGYNYYSMGSDCKWNAEVLAANKSNGYISMENPGSGTTKGSYWNATVVVTGSGFEAEGIVFENSFNQYISRKEAEDTVVMWASGSKGVRPTTYGDTSVQRRSFVERAAAIAITGDKSVFNNCKFIGRQDTLYGGQNIKAVFEKCDILGAVDFIFGGMTAVFYQCNLVMNTDDKTSSDMAYITAPQQASGRGYLMYNCTVTSTTPGVDTASETRSKPGYFGRPWQANTSEVVFCKTIIETTDYPDKKSSTSLIAPEGWGDSLNGQSPYMYEYGSIEKSGVDNSENRAAWVKANIDKEGTPITIDAFLGEAWTTELNARGLVKPLDLDSITGDTTPDTPGTDTPGSDTPGTDTPGTNTPGTTVTPVDPATPSDTTTPSEFEDSEIKVTAPEGAFNEADKVTFNADAVEAETTDNMFTFDLSFTNKNGDKLQPSVAVTVRIPLPAALTGKTVYVYHVEDDGTYTQIDCTVKDGMVVFTASRFSKYIVTSEKLAAASGDTSNASGDASSADSNSSNGGDNSGSSNSNPSTGIGGMNYALAAAAVFAGGAYVTFKKKRS